SDEPALADARGTDDESGSRFAMGDGVVEDGMQRGEVPVTADERRLGASAERTVRRSAEEWSRRHGCGAAAGLDRVGRPESELAGAVRRRPAGDDDRARIGGLLE